MVRTSKLLAFVAALTASACGSSAASSDAATSLDATSLDAGRDATSPSDGSFEDGSVTPGLDVDAYFDEFFGSLCRWFVRCEPKLGAVAFGELSCHPLRQETIRTQFARAVADGRADFDPAVATECLAGLMDASCNVASLDLTLCDAAFVGRALEGDACAASLDCRQGVCALGASCPGHCVVQHAGDACARPSECEAGLACRDGRCAEPAGAGESCTRRTDCAFPLTCGLAGTCAEPASSGDACATGIGGDLCAGDHVCRGGRCASGGGAGDACDGSNACAPGGRCVDGACVPTASVGEACEVNGCIALHACIDGHCTPLPHTGGACSVALPCVQGACRDGVCALLADGDMCDPDVQFGECAGFCRSGLCQSAHAEGETCRADSECAAGLACREADGRARCLPECG